VDNGTGNDSQTSTAAQLPNTLPEATTLAKYINDSVPDIIFFMAGSATLVDSIINVLVDFVNVKKGMLNISTYNESVTAKLLNQIYGLTGTAAYNGSSVGTPGGATKYDFTEITSYCNRILDDAASDLIFEGGPFKPDSTKWADNPRFVADDFGDGRGILISKLPATLKPLAYRTNTYTVGTDGQKNGGTDYTDHAYMVRDTVKGFFWCGDYAWANGRPNQLPATGQTVYPNYCGPDDATTPKTLIQPGLYLGSRYIYNNIAFCNSFAWAIDYAAVNRVP